MNKKQDKTKKWSEVEEIQKQNADLIYKTYKTLITKNPTIKVSSFYLNNILRRLRIMQEKIPGYLALADIPETKGYLLDAYKKLNMKSEQIIKIWRFVYMKLFDENGFVKLNETEDFCDKKGTYECKKIFWRFYFITHQDEYK